MGVIRKADLPLIGSSYNFVGADQGDLAVSIYFVEAEDSIASVHESVGRSSLYH